MALTTAENTDTRLLLPLLSSLPPAAAAGVRLLLENLRHHDAGLTFAHSVGVAAFAGACGRLMGLGTVSEITVTGLLHDVGKTTIAPALLLKPSALDPTERASVRKHPVRGEHLLRRLPGLSDIARHVRSHHECWDGTGYPDGLEGEGVTLPARIVTVADAFDAMTRDRVYRPGMPVDDALAELQRFSGRMFDPCVVDVFLDVVADMSHLVAAEPETLAPTVKELLSVAPRR